MSPAVILTLAGTAGLGLAVRGWELSSPSLRLPGIVVSSPAGSPWVGRSAAGTTVSVSPLACSPGTDTAGYRTR